MKTTNADEHVQSRRRRTPMQCILVYLGVLSVVVFAWAALTALLVRQLRIVFQQF